MLAKILSYALKGLSPTTDDYIRIKRDVEDAFNKLEALGVMFNSTGLHPVVVQVPRNRLGIKNWGKVDYLLRCVPGGRSVVLDTRVQSYEPRTTRVKEVRKEKLQKQELAAKKPWKYQPVRQ